MKFNYDLEINNILNNIYKKKLFSLAYKNNISNIDSENLNIYKNKFKSFDSKVDFTKYKKDVKFVVYDLENNKLYEKQIKK